MKHFNSTYRFHCSTCRSPARSGLSVRLFDAYRSRRHAQRLEAKLLDAKQRSLDLEVRVSAHISQQLSRPSVLFFFPLSAV